MNLHACRQRLGSFNHCITIRIPAARVINTTSVHTSYLQEPVLHHHHDLHVRVRQRRQRVGVSIKQIDAADAISLYTRWQCIPCDFNWQVSADNRAVCQTYYETMWNLMVPNL